MVTMKWDPKRKVWIVLRDHRQVNVFTDRDAACTWALAHVH